MGRAQASVPQNQGHVVKADRTRRAKDTLNKTIPDLIKANPRVRDGIAAAELISDPAPMKSVPVISDSSFSDGKTHIRIRIRIEDSLTAARSLQQGDEKVCVLNMGSVVRPGGGFLQGASSQEEFLCMRTTVYPSLDEAFYRLPDLGGIFTPDILVFRDSSTSARPLPKSDQFYVDIITAGMLRSADAEGAADDDGHPYDSVYSQKDREVITLKMKSVLRIAQHRGCKRLVLGAWGCGAYGNPVTEIASIWRKVIAGTPAQRRPNKERWEGIEDITFAITQTWMASQFVHAFKDVLADDGPSNNPRNTSCTNLMSSESDRENADGAEADTDSEIISQDEAESC